MLYTREYWIIYRGPGFLVVVWFDYCATPFSSKSSTNRGHIGSMRKREKQLADGRGGREWGRSQIIRWQENLVFYKSFNTHCCTQNYKFLYSFKTIKDTYYCKCCADRHMYHFMFIILCRLVLKRRFTDWPKLLIKQIISSLLQLVKSGKLLPIVQKVITSQIEIPEHLSRLSIQQQSKF